MHGKEFSTRFLLVDQQSDNPCAVSGGAVKPPSSFLLIGEITLAQQPLLLLELRTSERDACLQPRKVANGAPMWPGGRGSTACAELAMHAT